MSHASYDHQDPARSETKKELGLFGMPFTSDGSLSTGLLFVAIVYCVIFGCIAFCIIIKRLEGDKESSTRRAQPNDTHELTTVLVAKPERGKGDNPPDKDEDNSDDKHDDERQKWQLIEKIKIILKHKMPRLMHKSSNLASQEPIAIAVI